MDELIIRFLQGQANPVEKARLHRWRQASADNERHFLELERLWTITEAPDEPHASMSRVPSAAQLLAERQHRRDIRGGRRRWYGWGATTGAVAAAAVVVVALDLAPGRDRSAPPHEEWFAATEFTTGPAEKVTARLGDGSVVRLAPDSRLRVVPSADAREVWLDGRAYFAVAKQAGRPFVVRTRAGDALVLGTRFEVKVEDEALRVVVVEGRVALSSAEQRVEVGAGEISRVVPGAAPAVEAVESVEPELEWLDGFLVFQDTPLHQVAREVERQYGVRVLLPDRELAARTVTASFTDRGVEEVLMVVCRVVDAHCSLRGTVASIEP